MNYQNSYLELDERLYHRQHPVALDSPQAGHFNHEVALRLGWSQEAELMQRWVDILAGNYVPKAFAPLAMAYAGHQFGQWAGQLGDGRGLLMTQVLDSSGTLTDLHLKGAGLTPYSRMGDGRAVLRSTIREYLCGHALSHLGIASSNALGFVVSKTRVRREHIEQGAALMRVADCHIRLGHVEWIASFAPDLLQSFTYYMLDTYYPQCRAAKQPILEFLGQVVERTATLIADWQLLGFAHGVMNTDNLSITGSTLDFGPFGFMERFDPAWINNHSDHSGRYSYQNQPAIGYWNLNVWLPHFLRLSHLGITRDGLAGCLARYEPTFRHHHQIGICAKLGLSHSEAHVRLAHEWLSLLEDARLDYTNSFAALPAVVIAMPEMDGMQSDEMQSDDGIDLSTKATPHQPDVDHDASANLAHARTLLNTLTHEIGGSTFERWQAWRGRYGQAVLAEGRSQVLQRLQAHNPVYVLRNAMAQQAIVAAEGGDFSEVDRLYHLLSQPYQIQQIAVDSDTQVPKIGERGLAISCSS